MHTHEVAFALRGGVQWIELFFGVLVMLAVWFGIKEWWQKTAKHPRKRR